MWSPNSDGEASTLYLENSSKEINPSSSKSNHQSNCDNSSDEKRVKRRSRKNLKLDFWDEHPNSHGRTILRKSRREVDRLSVADSDSRELENIQNKNYGYKRNIRNLKLPESNFNFKESHALKRRAQRSIHLQKNKRARRRSYDNKVDDSTEISDDESWRRKSTRHKRGAIRYKEPSDQQTDTSEASKFEQANQNESQETINIPRGQTGDIKENPVDNTKDEINAVKSETSEPKRRRWWMISQKTVYGLGHISNDFCAAMWFSYMMLFFQAVMEMKSVVAGYMMLLGQVVDALATPAAGILVDRFSTKKFWHLMGATNVIITFPGIFIRCIGCSITADPAFLSWWMPVYYAAFIIVFQIGWAIVQISHLAMIPAISESSQDRAELTSIRTMASMASSVMVYLITWIILKTTHSYIIGPDDDYKFRNVVLIITGISIITTVLFHIFFKIKPKVTSEKDPIKDDHDTTTKFKDTILYFLKMPSLYYTSLLYVFSRLYWTLSLVYVPLFLEERLVVNPIRGSELVASVPLVVYISSFLFSLLLKKFIHYVGNQIAYLIGSIISVISCVWIALFIHPAASVAHIYAVAVVIGAGSAITQVSSLSITADLIGTHTQQGAIVYSIVTFADKLICGIVVVVIEHFKCENSDECPQYYRGVLSYACGSSALLGILILCIQILMSKYKRKK